MAGIRAVAATRIWARMWGSFLKNISACTWPRQCAKWGTLQWPTQNCVLCTQKCLYRLYCLCIFYFSPVILKLQSVKLCKWKKKRKSFCPYLSRRVEKDKLLEIQVGGSSRDGTPRKVKSKSERQLPWFSFQSQAGCSGFTFFWERRTVFRKPGIKLVMQYLQSSCCLFLFSLSLSLDILSQG